MQKEIKEITQLLELRPFLEFCGEEVDVLIAEKLEEIDLNQSNAIKIGNTERKIQQLDKILLDPYLQPILASYDDLMTSIKDKINLLGKELQKLQKIRFKLINKICPDDLCLDINCLLKHGEQEARLEKINLQIYSSNENYILLGLQLNIDFPQTLAQIIRSFVCVKPILSFDASNYIVSCTGVNYCENGFTLVNFKDLKQYRHHFTRHYCDQCDERIIEINHEIFVVAVYSKLTYFNFTDDRNRIKGRSNTKCKIYHEHCFKKQTIYNRFPEWLKEDQFKFFVWRGHGFCNWSDYSLDGHVREIPQEEISRVVGEATCVTFSPR